MAQKLGRDTNPESLNATLSDRATEDHNIALLLHAYHIFKHVHKTAAFFTFYIITVNLYNHRKEKQQRKLWKTK